MAVPVTRSTSAILQVGQHCGEVGDIDVAAADVAQVVAVRLFLDVADAVFGNDRPVAIAELSTALARMQPRCCSR